MRLSITTFKIFEGWDIGTMCAELPKAGVEAVEFRISAGHKHGVELDTDGEARRTVRKKLADAGLAVCSVATGCSFHWPESGKVQENVEQAMQAIKLAADLGAPRIRVFGNNIVEGISPDDTAIQVGRALRELAPVGERAGVDVLLEMHGDFNDWRLNREAVEFANHRAVGTLYNCDNRDLVNGSISTVFHEMKALIRHIHMHDLTDESYPCEELFGLLAADGYSGFMSMEVSMDGDVRENLRTQANRFRELRERSTRAL